MAQDNSKKKAIYSAVNQIEKQFGKAKGGIKMRRQRETKEITTLTIWSNYWLPRFVA